ncbi:MAG: DNA internalization-related competence protein ComEC/Rec2, partial [Nitrospirota bacterium]
FYSFIRQDTLPEMKFPAGDIRIEGTIIDVPQKAGEKLRFTIDEAVVEKRRIEGRIKLVILPNLLENKTSEIPVNPGDRISAVARLRAPFAFRNPGIISYDLKKQGFAATGYVKSIRIIGEGKGMSAGISNHRWKLGRTINRSLSAENASLHNAMITGLTGGISREMRDAFSATGLAHVLSISGTHFGLLAFLFFTLTRAAVKCMPSAFLIRMTLYITPTGIAVWVTLPVLAVYAVLSGLSTPTIRSFIMVFIYMLSLLLGRKDQWLNSLAIAATLILLWEPETLSDLSFMLSFSAVLSIGYVLEQRPQSPELGPAIPGRSFSAQDMALTTFREVAKSSVGKAYEKAKTGMLISIAAVLGTAPFVALYFKQFPLISPLTNLIVTPFICFVILPLGFISGFTALIFNMSVMPISGFIDALTSFALRITNIFTNIPYASVYVHNPSFAITAGYFFSLMFLVKNRSRWKFAPMAVVVGIYLVTPFLSEHKLRAAFLDAGQGDATVVELPDRKVMLIDGSTEDPDIGRMVIAPYLWSKGIKRIDFMVLSHSHPDHYGGLIYVLKHFDVGAVWSSGMVSDGARMLFQEAARRNIPARILRRGDLLDGNKYRIYVLHPYNEFNAGSSSEDYAVRNNDSLILKLESEGVSLLFSGDIEQEAEENILHLGSLLKSDVIKVPHHGGRTSSYEQFILAVRPEVAVVSTGRGNSYGHPHKETIERYEKAGARVFRTDVNGAVIMTGTGRSYEIKTYADSVFKKVDVWRDEIRNLRLLF